MPYNHIKHFLTIPRKRHAMKIFFATISALTALSLSSGEELSSLRPRRLMKKSKKKSSTLFSSKTAVYSAAISDPLQTGACTGVCGTVTFSKPTFESDLTLVTYQISGLTDGLHGLHVHANQITPGGDCLTTGGHWNPTNTNHGSNLDAQRHLGDLGNVLSASGSASGNLLANVPLHDLDELAVVIHAGQDDLGLAGNDASRAVGNAGGRPGCGNIVKVG